LLTDTYLQTATDTVMRRMELARQLNPGGEQQFDLSQPFGPAYSPPATSTSASAFDAAFESALEQIHSDTSAGLHASKSGVYYKRGNPGARLSHHNMPIRLSNPPIHPPAINFF
jgi:hypothetical protein